VFDRNSAQHRELVSEKLPRLISPDDNRDELIAAMNAIPLKIKYLHLVGTAFKPRQLARCNGIIQAAVKGQRRDFISDWPADCYVRWAHCLGFIFYDYIGDSFGITEIGQQLTEAYTSDTKLNEQEYALLTSALLTYPPAIRILSLLSPEGIHLTKFELGQQIGFIGESGFGSMPQSTLIRSLTTIIDTKEKNTMRNN
jgi:hypothetical protein